MYIDIISILIILIVICCGYCLLTDPIEFLGPIVMIFWAPFWLIGRLFQFLFSPKKNTAIKLKCWKTINGKLVWVEVSSLADRSHHHKNS
jgi:hypothetical protein